MAENTGDILVKLQKGFGPEVGDELTKKVANPLQGFLRQVLKKDFESVQPQKSPATEMPFVTNDGNKNVATLTNDIKKALGEAGLKTTPQAPKTGFFGGKPTEKPTVEKPQAQKTTTLGK
ncbi:MAG: hypothetical protein PVI75_06325 [Gammaproteobacteria bacterium]|jgi:hypothetical protein